jgi:hypothetical protein
MSGPLLKFGATAVLVSVLVLERAVIVAVEICFSEEDLRNTGIVQKLRPPQPEHE